MSPDAVTVSLLLLPTAALAVLAASPSDAWRAGAEHSRRFWCGWVLLAGAVGLVGWAQLGGGIGNGWLALWCAVGSLQPSMVADVLDVRALRRDPGPPRPAPIAAAGVTEASPPIHWQAPAADGAPWAPRAEAGSGPRGPRAAARSARQTVSRARP
jgi:hypothetical protein